MNFYNTLLDDLSHLLIIGPTGTGKSKLIEALIKHLTLEKDSPVIFLLDPGGSTARAVENFATKSRLEGKTIILDPEQSDFYLSYNPLKRVNSLPLSLQAKFVQEAILTALEINEKDSIFYMPILEQVLYHLAYILIETNYTFEESQYLLSTRPNGVAGELIEKAQTKTVQSFWQDLQKLKPRERQQLLGLCQARLLPFITSPTIKAMLSQKERAIDFPELIEEGKLFIANLESYSSLTPLDSKILSNLLISSIVQACFSRPAYTGREVYLFIEECGEGLIGTEIGKMLRRARKQNLKVILINQDISSMREQNPVVFHQIWANTTHKVVFRDLPQEDLDLIGLEFFGEEFNLKTLKDEIYRTFFEPKESQRTIYSSSFGHSSFQGKGSASSVGSAEVFAQQEGLLPLQESLRLIESQASASSSSEGEGEFETETETTVPFYEFLKRKELSSRDFYPLEELLHLAKARLKSLGPREIALKQRGKKVKILKVPFTPDIPRIEKYTKRAREHIFNQSGCYATIKEIEKEQAQRLKELKRPSGSEPKYKG